MNARNLMEALGQIDCHYLTEALDYRRPIRWKHWVALAACAALIFAAARPTAELPPPQNTDPQVTDPPPQATESAPPSWSAPIPPESIPPGQEIGDGNGFEGYLVYNIAELQTGSPWTAGDGKLDTLPVFEYLVIPDGRGTVGTPEEMREMIYEAFDRLGIPPEAVTLDEGEPEYCYGTAQDFRVRVSNTLVGALEFTDPIPLPEGYHFDFDSTYEELEQVAVWILEYHGHLLGFQEPVAVIEGGDYNFSGEQGYTLSFREGAGTLEEQIVNFGRRILVGHEDNCLRSIQLLAAPKWTRLGDYSLRTIEEAINAMYQGDYYTDVPYPLTGMERFERIDLIYRRWEFDTLCQPYYRFFVELPQEQRGDLKNYGVYYVPAVEAPQ